MTPPASPGTAPSARFLPLLLLLFFGSGCAALIYEVVWFQLLQLVIGSSALSLAVLLGTFMGGMCLGSLALGRFVSARTHPLRVYAVLEAGIALTALVVLIAVPVVGRAYLTLVGHGFSGLLLRGAVCALVLLPPTLLMGATLPAIARWVESTPRGVAWLGWFYGGNTVGAVAGCLLAGFYLLRVHDTSVATAVAVVLNLGVATLAFVLSLRAPALLPPPPPSVPPSPPLSVSPSPRLPPRASPAALHTVLALSGFSALAAEVVWARQLSLLLGATVYTFAIILAVFLVGLALGSAGGATLARRLAQPALALAGCQAVQVLTLAWAAYAIAVALPAWPVNAAVPSLAAKFQYDLLRCAFAILPAAVGWGASFPLALAALRATDPDPARLVGRAYAANTLGAIVGAVGCGLVLTPLLGTRHTHVVLLGTSLLAAALALRPARRADFALLGAAAAVAVLAAVWLPRIPWQLVAYGRQIATTDYGARALYFGEGMNSSVAVSETPGGARFFHVSGKTEASSIEQDMRLQRMLAHLPALFHRAPKSVLIVGCGAGVTAGSFVLHPSIERIVICDIEPLIPGVVATYFGAENHHVVRDPRVQIVHDDARHYIATTTEKFDLITSDPIHPWVKGSAVLYSLEYFELCRARLNPGGLVTQWVPLYESDRAVVQSEIATFFTVFPHGTIWGNDDDGFGYDTVLLGQNEPLRIDLDALQARFARPDHAPIRDSLALLGLGSALDLVSTYAGRLPELREWLAGAEINRDRTLRLQYLAGLHLESTQGAATYHEILDRRRFPESIFHGSPELLGPARQLLGK